MNFITGEKSPAIIRDLFEEMTNNTMSLMDIAWEQQKYHESRRWSVVDKFKSIDFQSISYDDKVIIWNAGRAELTTKPGADRLASLSDYECRKWKGKNDIVAAIMQACGTWSRYWNEEEAFHETSLNILAGKLGMPPVDNETFIEFRQIFPNDDMLRTLFLLACSEIVASVNYAVASEMAKDQGLKDLFFQISQDEMQHMNYFISFAKALVASGEYRAKEAFSIAHLFLKEDGELRGSARGEKVVKRDGHVNWWDHLEKENISSVPLQPNVERKEAMILIALKRVTGISCKSAEEVEDTWMDLVDQS